MKVEDEIVDALRGECRYDPPNHRFAGHGHRRFCADVAERTQPRAEARRQHDGVSNRRLAGNHLSADAAIARPSCVTSRRTKTYIVKHSIANAGNPKYPGTG